MTEPGTPSRDTRQWLQDALEAHDFCLYLQPIVDLSSGEVRQQEVLLRLIEDERHCDPQEFLPAAAELGLASEIDRMVIGDAIEILASGEAEVLDVNLAGSSFGDPEVLDAIESGLSRAGVEPSRLVIEVTETEAIADMKEAIAFANALHGMGCRLALDDFGVGFSSLFYVKHMPLEFVKIDGEFVRDLTSNERSREMVSGMAKLARELRLTTVAEFISDEETVGLLRGFGVECGQGYHLGRPKEAARAPVRHASETSA